MIHGASIVDNINRLTISDTAGVLAQIADLVDANDAACIGLSVFVGGLNNSSECWAG